MALAWAVDDDDVSGGEARTVPPSQLRSGPADAIGQFPQAVEVAAPRPLSVLVADDEAALRQSLAAILERAGHRVVEAEDGQVALNLLRAHAFDVVILDLHMPNADGLALLRQVEVPPPIVILYSAFAYFSPDAVRDEVGAKVFRYLQKPVPPLEFLAVVNEAAAELGR